MTKIERAVQALREAADALDDVSNLQRVGILGPLVATHNLRSEAEYLERMAEAVKAADS